jgi:hypothetical protein
VRDNANPVDHAAKLLGEFIDRDILGLLHGVVTLHEGRFVVESASHLSCNFVETVSKINIKAIRSRQMWEFIFTNDGTG